MPEDSGEQLSAISKQVDVMIQLLGQQVQATSEQTVKQETDQARHVSMKDDDAERSNEKSGSQVRKIVEEPDPVKILGFSPKALTNLSAAVASQNEQAQEKMEKKSGGFISELLSTIGMPLMALAGGITALLVGAGATGIDFGKFEGLTRMVGKYGLMGALKVFMKPFAKFTSKKMLKAIPVIGGLASFYYAKQAYENSDWVSMGLNILSGALNLFGTFLAPGVANGLAFGVDVLDAVLTSKVAGLPDDQQGRAKLDLIKEFAQPMLDSIGGINTLKYLPFVGSFFHAHDAYNYFKDGNIGEGLLSSVQAFSLLFPVVGTAVSGGIGILRALADPAKKKQDPIAGKVIDFGKQLSDGFWNMIKSWYQGLDPDGAMKWIVDKVLPDDMLRALGRTKLTDEQRVAGNNMFNNRELQALERSNEYLMSKEDMSDADRERVEQQQARIEQLKKNLNDNKRMTIRGRRADGGSIEAGETYLVGERGPELVQPTQSGYVHSNEDIVNLLKQNNDILTNLSTEIVTAVRETGTVVNNSVANSTVNQSGAITSAQSFRDHVRDTMFR